MVKNHFKRLKEHWKWNHPFYYFGMMFISPTIGVILLMLDVIDETIADWFFRGGLLGLILIFGCIIGEVEDATGKNNKDNR